MADAKAFGANLQKLRKHAKLSQADLANDCDFDLSQISRIERGVTNTSVSNIIIIANALGIEPKDLFDFKFPEKRK